MSARFPVGGSRDAVYSFLRSHGFVMSSWSDKHWGRADGLSLVIYGVGSKARIHNQDGALLADDDIDVALTRLAKVRA